MLDELERASARTGAAGPGSLGGAAARHLPRPRGCTSPPPALSAFRQRAHPGTGRSRSRIYDPPSGVAAVAAGEVDLALTHTYHPAEPVPPSCAAAVRLEPALVEELVLVTALGTRARQRLVPAAAGGAGRASR
ncbi:hypothetical protein LT493_32605 [Streptomyces tricolor]|nr:hypothetical protein [Streptomyces tricolor]